MKRPRVKTGFSLGVLAVAAMVLKPSVAGAHLVTTGMGPVYDGIGHLLLSPDDLVPALAVGLYAGLLGKSPGRRALFFLPLAWLAGGLAGLMSAGTFTYSLSAVSFLLLGGLIAADLRIPKNIFMFLALTDGSVHGFSNGIAMRGGPGISGLLGIAAMLFVMVALSAAFVVSLRAGWPRITVRVTGSWITAIGLLMLGWLVRGSV